MKELIDSLNVAAYGIGMEETTNAVMEEVNNGLLFIGVDSIWADKLDNWVVLTLIVVIALLANVVCHRIILRAVSKLVKRTKATWDDIVFDDKVMVHVSRMVAPILIYVAIPIAFPGHTDSVWLDILHRACLVYIIVVSLRFVSVFLAAVYHVFSEKDQYRDRPLKGLLQTAQVAVFLIGAILVLSIIIKKDLSALLAGLGASAAVLMLVFRDSIMGVVSGIQLTANNMLKVGDWIIMPKYDANGTVIEVTLNTVKVRNWDNSITTIPPYLLISDSFQNWQAMRESGGRRVMRSINIDMTTVRFCTAEMMDRFRKITLLKEYIEGEERRIREYNEANGVDGSTPINGMRLTNLGVFRAYLTNYLKSLPVVNTDLMYMVRQLQPTEKGIPLEIYFFSRIKDWVPYEGVQADVFDHVLAIVPEFGLRIFQVPSGEDMRKAGLLPERRTDSVDKRIN